MPFSEREIFKSDQVERPQLLFLWWQSVAFKRNRVDEKCVVFRIKDMRRERHLHVVVGSGDAFFKRNGFEEQLVGGHLPMIECSGKGSTALLKSFNVVCASLCGNVSASIEGNMTEIATR